MSRCNFRIRVGRTHDKKPFYYDSKEMENLLILEWFGNQNRIILKRIISGILSEYTNSNICFIIFSPCYDKNIFDLFRQYDVVKIYKDEKTFHEKLKDLMMIKEGNSIFLDDTFSNLYGKQIGEKCADKINEIGKTGHFDQYFVIIDDGLGIFRQRDFMFDIKRLFTNSSKFNINLIICAGDFCFFTEQNKKDIMSIINSKIVFNSRLKDSFTVLGDGSAFALNKDNFEAYYQSKTGEKIKLNMYVKN